MMQSCLGVVDKERAKNIVVKTWAGQVRDLAYDVEDCIELVAHLDNKSDWWRRLLPGCMAAVLTLDKAVAEIKQLKPRTVDVSHRITQYGLSGIIDLFSPDAARATALNMLAEARNTMREFQGLRDLTQLITKEQNDLGVISVWGIGKDLRELIIRKAYQDPEICKEFGCRGWIRLTHPFNHHEFLKSLVTQFYTNSCLQRETYIDEDTLRSIGTGGTAYQGCTEILLQQMERNRCLIVLENLCTMVEWDAIRACLPHRKMNGSCIIVSTEQQDIASLCIGHSYQILELKQYKLEQPVFVFFKEDSRGKEIGRLMEDKVEPLSRYHRIGFAKKAEASSWLNQFSLVGRESQLNEVRNYLSRATCSNDYHVMSVWGIAGVGKSDLIRCVYCEIMLREDSIFDKFGWVRVSYPFDLRVFFQSLLLDFHQSGELGDPISVCNWLLKEYRCLVVIDDVMSTEEWDLLQPVLVSEHSRSVIIVITTKETTAMYCADNEHVLNIRGLDAEASFDLFTKEVQRKNPGSPLLQYPEVNNEELEELISKCGGLPKVIASVAGYLAPKTVTCMASTETLNRTFVHSLQQNSEFVGVRGIFHWLDAYIGTWPDFLKQCILYLSVFSRYQPIRRRRLLRRWIAEGYIKQDSQTVSAEESGEWSFSRLFDTCITEPSPHSVSSIINDTRAVLFQINRFVGHYILSQPTEENLFIELEESCTVATQRVGRHLSIRKNWARDRTVFESIDFLRLRSLTVSGRWESYFISESMRVLRVLDLEDSSGVTDKDLEKIVTLLSRLKFLSLRGCSEIRRLPRRLGDLRQLETLDVRGTSVSSIPGTTVKLKKLQYMRAGTTVVTTEPSGVNLPEGIEKLTLLTTLGVFDISASAGKAIVKELSKLTQLRKLGVSGVNKNNSKEFFAAISCHVRLESLSVWLMENQDCLNNDSTSPFEHPRNLQSLKIHGVLKEVPAWLRDLHKLTKLQLETTIPAQTDINEVLREIRQLRILHIRVKPLQDVNDGELDFRHSLNGIQEQCYSMLKVLDITSTSILNIRFGSEAMPNLELLTARCCSGSAVRFIDLNNLSRYYLKEVRLIGSDDNALKNDIEGQLNQHPRKPRLKWLPLPLDG